MTKTIQVYTTTTCPYCVKAKNLLRNKNLDFQEIDVNTPELRESLLIKANGRKTVPQIFIGDFHVGGCDDLYALDAQGKLDQMLNQ